MYKVSVIVPVYNSEKFLENTILTVVNQTIGFENIELILIDDNSTDNSKHIIQKFSDKYDNVKGIFLQENHGYAGYGRNLGIKCATADYIMFLDNDDEYDEDICKTLYEFIIKTGSDLVDCSYKESLITSDDTLIKNTEDVKTISDEVIYHEYVYVWTKIFKKSIIRDNDIQFITQGLNEDSLFSIEYFKNSKEITFLPQYQGYKHILHDENLSSVTFDFTLNMLNSYYLILNLLDEDNVKYDYNRIFTGRIHTTLIRTILMSDGNFKYIKKIVDELYSFENNEIFNKIELDSFPINFINMLILKDHKLISSLILYFSNKLANIKLLIQIYRKIKKK